MRDRSPKRSLTPGFRRDEWNEDNISWRAGLDWPASEGMLLYANVSKGYDTGSPPTIPAFEQSELAPVTLEPVLAYEVGFNVPLVRNLIEATSAVFAYQYEDKQLQGRLPTILGILPGLVNVPRWEVLAAEGQANVFPIYGLTLTLAGTYPESEVVEASINSTSPARRQTLGAIRSLTHQNISWCLTDSTPPHNFQLRCAFRSECDPHGTIEHLWMPLNCMGFTLLPHLLPHNNNIVWYGS